MRVDLPVPVALWMPTSVQQMAADLALCLRMLIGQRIEWPEHLLGRHAKKK